VSFFNFKKKEKGEVIEKAIKKEDKKVLSVSEFTKELGIGRDGVIGSYDTEENPDDLGPKDYIEMQRNDGEVQAIVRLLTLPIVSTPLYVEAAEGDNGERDFIETVFFNPPSLGGMTTPLPFIISDMTRGIFEGFRVYEKVARIIEDGDYKGKVGWKKLAPRDAQTVELKADEHGGFNGVYQQATLGDKTVEVAIPVEKSMLFTFQKEKHWLYGESILRTAYYHYDKKHKLYYISHKKAEIDTTGLKILKINQTATPSEREAAETAADTLGVNTRITLPPGIELEIQRGGESGFNTMPLILHHNNQMSKSALVQVLDQVKYAYPYGKGTPASQYVDLAIVSIMNQMEATINTYAVAPLIDWNYGTKAYPKIRFEKLADASVAFLRDVFGQIMKGGQELPEGFIQEIVNETAKTLKLKWVDDGTGLPEKKEEVVEKPTDDEEDDKEDDKDDKKVDDKKEEKKDVNKKALFAFERGKKSKADQMGIDSPKTPKELKDKLLKLKIQPDFESKCFKLGEKFTNVINNRE